MDKFVTITKRSTIGRAKSEKRNDIIKFKPYSTKQDALKTSSVESRDEYDTEYRYKSLGLSSEWCGTGSK